MLTKIAKAAFLTASISSTLMSCSKQDEVQPTATSPAIVLGKDAQVKMVNGRVVFANLAAFNATQDALAKLGNSTGIQALVDWEKSLQFSSLRAAAKAEDNQLEALETKGIPTPAHDLMYKFGFPTSYASLINTDGEYQVGNQIYWFHDGIKYQADSEEELAAIKKNPAIAKVKLIAGSHIIKSLKETDADRVSRTTASSYPDSDGKWYHEYYQDNNSGNERRIKYVSAVYTEDMGTAPGGYYKNWYTQLNLQARHEYYSRGKRTWYPVGGQPFVWTLNISYDATASAPYQTPAYNPTKYGNLSQQLQFDSGSYGTIVLASQNITTTTVDPYFRVDSIKWDFEINGSISGYNGNDRTYGTYNVSGLLW